MGSKSFMEGYEIRSPGEYGGKVALSNGPKCPIKDSEGNFVGTGIMVTVIEKEALYGHKRPNGPAYDCLMLRPDNFGKEKRLERQFKWRKHVLVPVKDIGFEQLIGPVPSRLKFRKEELHKYTEVRI